jgi:methylmalonyl-CoA/ethylmalonyl-CoA epimerase
MSAPRLSHIGIAVQDLEQQVGFYRDVLGLELAGIEDIPDQGVRVAILRAGEAAIELLQPLSPASPVARFLERRGEGVHHLAYEVEGLDRVLDRLRSSGVRLIDQAPRRGAHGMRIAFLHPSAAHGVLTELCERGKERS